MSENISSRVLFLHCVFGLSDACTGSLLVFYPDFIFSILFLSPKPESYVYVSYVGVFVFLTGFYYILPLLPRLPRHLYFSFSQVWLLTSIIRILVAIFIVVSIFSGRLSVEWILVALSDAFIACIQYVMIKRHLYA